MSNIFIKISKKRTSLSLRETSEDRGRWNRKIRKTAPTLRWNRILLLLFAIGLTSLISVILFRSGEELVATDKSIAPVSVNYDDHFESIQNWLSGHKRIREHLAKGQTVYELLAGLGISPQDIMRIDGATRPLFDLSMARPGQIIDIWLKKKSVEVEKISLHLAQDQTLHIIRNAHDFFPSLIDLSKITVPTAINGEVSNSFYQSAIERDIPPDIIMEIADIFAWDVDFLVDIRPGDTFEVIFNKYYRKGECIGHGEVLSARIVNQKRIHESFYFTDSQGRPGYYDRKGQSLRKAFLKSPLRYRRIGSSFSSRRFHPILKVYRPHYGVDYVAPSGTPVESVGDGRVSFIGWKGGYGRYIRIRHNHIYKTGYGHLGRFARGLKKGSRVRQGDVIGYVGSSGLSTGPHLDFSMIKRGRFVNPIRIKSRPALVLMRKDRKRFNELVIQMEQKWEEYQNS